MKIPPFAVLYKKVQRLAFQKKLVQIYQEKEKQEETMRNVFTTQKAKWNPIQPILPLIKLKPAEDEKDKTKIITFELKLRAGAPAGSTTYKKAVRVFEDGSPQDWMDLLKNFNEIWKQNSVNGAHDRAATIMAALKGDSLTAFEAALDDARINPDGDGDAPLVMTVDHIEIALKNVTNIVFPHRALEIQKLWMNRAMRKPHDMTTRMTASALSRINNCLPLFPLGTPASKFSDEELVGLLEWSLPPAWRAKFDLKGYIPSLGSKEKLIEECEAIERSEKATKDTSNEKDDKKNNAKKKGVKFADGSKIREATNNVYFCKQCGRNRTHETAQCYILKNREKRLENNAGVKNDSKPAAKPFSKRTFRKEVNAMARKAVKTGALDLYSAALKREQDKATRRAKTATKKRAAAEDADSSDDDESVNIMEKPIPRKKQRKENKVLEEERAFLKKISQAEKEDNADTSSEEEDE